MPYPATTPTRLRDVPLFPLPGVVLFPRAILPLHIFEPRYRTMVADALAGERRVAIGLLEGDWVQHPGSSPAVHAVVGVGKLVAHERLPDGRLNILLEGELRGRILAQNHALSYRRADVEVIVGRSVFDLDLAAERQRLAESIAASALGAGTLGAQIAKLVAGPMSTADVADICAFNLLEDAALKQRLLEDADVERRVRAIVAAVRAAHPTAHPAATWPRPSNLN